MNVAIALYQRRMMREWVASKTTGQLIWHLYALGRTEPNTYIGQRADAIRAEILRREVVS